MWANISFRFLGVHVCVCAHEVGREKTELIGRKKYLYYIFWEKLYSKTVKVLLYVVSLSWFVGQKIQEYQHLKEEIMLLRITVPLSMFCLDCVHLNNELALRSQRLKERLIVYEVDENRDLNRL